MNNWRALIEDWKLSLTLIVCCLFVGIAAIGSFMVDTPNDEAAEAMPAPKKPQPKPAPEPDKPIETVGPEPTPLTEDEFDKLKDDLRDESAKNAESEVSQNYPCECTPTCPCDAEHCQCRGKERCSEACPCHKKVATFHCPKCQRNGYCDYDPDVPADSHPHRVCRDCKQWMDRVDPPMTAQEGYDVIVWRRVQQKMQAEAKAKEQAVKAAAERRKQRSSMPVYDPWGEGDDERPGWRGRRFYFNSTSLPAAGCKT